MKSMLKQIVPIIVVGLLIIGGYSTVATSEDENDDKNVLLETTEIFVSEPIIEEKGEYVIVELNEATSQLMSTGKPILPVITKTFSFEAGTVIYDTKVQIDWKKIDLSNKIKPAPGLLPHTTETTKYEQELGTIDESVYSSTELYPSEPYTIHKRAGLKDDEHVIYVNIRCNAQYSPANDYINVPTNIKIDIEYNEPKTKLFTADEYDLLIITHEKFAEDLQTLVDHKNIIGMRTKMETVDKIYSQYNGVADWEEIKLFIADAIETWGITYVLLAGGHKGQTNDWWVPDFRSHNWNPLDTYDPPYDETFSADLYFADVFYTDQYGLIHFDDWDSNNNGIYGEGPDLYPGGGTYDHPDLVPDVHLGRLPIRYSWEVPVVVDKIINYENNADDSWFKKAVLVGGDGFPTERYPGQAEPGIYEGEIVCDVMANLLIQKDFEITKAYCSDEGDVMVTEIDDVTTEMRKGAGFVHMTGHADPFLLGSYYPNVLPLIPFYNAFNIRKYDNAGKLPFMICEGCHNAQFDVTTQNLVEILFGGLEYPIYRNEWLPHDTNSWLVLKEGGGAIAIIGNTALGLGGINNWCTEFVGGWINIRFVHAYAIQDKEYIGTVWSTGVTDYINEFPCDNDMGDRKTAEERVLLGDPSIKLGGYGGSMASGSGDSNGDDNGKTNENSVSVDVPTWEKGDSWTYHLDNIDFSFSEVEGRSIDFELSAGDIKLEVVDVTADRYVADISSDDINVSFGISFDFLLEDKEPIELPYMSFQNIKLNGQMLFEKETLGIEKVEITLVMDIMENLDGLPLELPPIVEKLTFISIPANIDLTIEFDNPFLLMEFPLENSNSWGVEETNITVSIDGEIKSIWLRILNIINKIIPIIPEEFAKYLPVVDISDVLNDFGILSEYEINVPFPIDEYEYTKFFKVSGQETVNVGAGSYDATKISLLDDNGNIYYSQDAKNIVKISGYVSDYYPFIEDLNLELVSVSS